MSEKKYKVNISIDDVTPHPYSSVKVLERCSELIDIFPNIKFSLFIPTAYWRTQKPITITPEPLTLTKYPDFCDLIRVLPKENFEVGYHGHYHGIPGENDNNELLDVNYEQAKEKIQAMFDVVEAVDLKDTFKLILRPPAWRMGPDCFDACKDMGIRSLALSDIDYALESNKGKDKEYGSVSYSNVFPPFRPLEFHEKTGIVYHACEWDRDYLDVTKREKLTDFLTKELDNIEFVFLEDLV